MSQIDMCEIVFDYAVIVKDECETRSSVSSISVEPVYGRCC